MTQEEKEYLRLSHEYTLQEVRLTGEDIKAYICEKYDARLDSLEHSRTYTYGFIGAIAAFMGMLKAGWVSFGQKQ